MIQSQLFFNRCFDKGKLKGLISWTLRNYGESVTLDLVEKLKDVGFLWATKAGISLSIDDLKIPKEKGALLLEAESTSTKAYQQFLSGNLTTVERLQQLIDAWHRTSENLKQEVVSNFRKTDPLNPVYMMAFSGARGNISQVRQLVGMRGLMADPQGRIIDFPIRSNFREGLTLTEYVISCYGARKGIVDTALRTATSGYLTRRLVDVAQHVVVALYDCETEGGIPLTGLKQGAKTLLPLSERILGRVLAEDISGVAPRNVCISEYLAYKISQVRESILVRSPLLCKTRNGVCQLCYGWSLAHNELVSIGEAVGIIAAQSIGEPGTQLTMRTFHTGGVFSGEIIDQVQAPISGFVSFPTSLKGSLVRTSYGKVGFLTRESGTLRIQPFDLTCESKDLTFPVQSILFVRQGQKVLANDILLEYAAAATDQDQGIQATHLLTSPQKGEVFFEDVVVIKDELNTEIQAYQLGSFWLLTSHLYANLKNTVGSFNYLKGDLLEINAPLTTTKLVNLAKNVSYLNKKLQTTSVALNTKAPTLTSKLITLNTENFHYTKGNYLTQLNNSFVLSYSVSSEKQNFFKFFATSLINLFGLSLSLTEKIDGMQTNKTSLSFLLGTEFLWYFLLKENISLLKVFNKSKVKAFHFVNSKSVFIKKKSASVSLKQKRLGAYVFKKTKKAQTNAELGLSENKYYLDISKKLSENYFSNEVIWKVSCEKFNLIESFSSVNTKLNNSIIQFIKLKNGGSVIWQNSTLRPVVKQVSPQAIFCTFTRTNKPVSTFVNILVTEPSQTVNKVVLLPLVHKMSCFSSVSVASFHINATSPIANKQNVDTVLKFDSLFSLTTQPLTLNVDNPFYIFQLQPKQNLDTCYWNISTTATNQVNIFSDLNILLPTGSKTSVSRFNFSEFDWRHAKRKLVQDYFVVAQLNKKVSEPTEIFKTLKSPDSPNSLGLKEVDLFGVVLPPNSHYIYNSFLGSLIRPGNEIIRNGTLATSGQILSIRKNGMVIRKALPILFSSKANFHVFHGDFIEKGLPLITLTYKRLTTGDIVQGIPRIEQLFEARQTTTILHEQLHELFETYKTRMRLNVAARKSFQKIQRILIDSIQRVYQSQGVTISDKHLEVIVRQMTSTVRILEGGRTRLLRGELKPIDWIEKINLGIEIQKAEYEPILLGITKASLETESFISAASFQETTRTLGRAAIEGRTDFLRGLKENVILGHRVPAGTGAPLISYLTKFSNSNENSKENFSDLNFLLKD